MSKGRTGKGDWGNGSKGHTNRGDEVPAAREVFWVRTLGASSTDGSTRVQLPRWRRATEIVPYPSMSTEFNMKVRYP